MKQLMLGQKYAAMVAITEHEEKYMQLYIYDFMLIVLCLPCITINEQTITTCKEFILMGHHY